MNRLLTLTITLFIAGNALGQRSFMFDNGKKVLVFNEQRIIKAVDIWDALTGTRLYSFPSSKFAGDSRLEYHLLPDQRELDVLVGGADLKLYTLDLKSYTMKEPEVIRKSGYGTWKLNPENNEYEDGWSQPCYTKKFLSKDSSNLITVETRGGQYDPKTYHIKVSERSSGKVVLEKPLAPASGKSTILQNLGYDPDYNEMVYVMFGKKGFELVRLKVESGASPEKVASYKLQSNLFTPISDLGRIFAFYDFTTLTLKGIDSKSGEELWTLPYPKEFFWNQSQVNQTGIIANTNGMNRVVFNDSIKQLAVLSLSKKKVNHVEVEVDNFKIYDTENGELVRQVTFPEGYTIRDFDLASDRLLCTSDYGKTMAIFKLSDTSRPLKEFRILTPEDEEDLKEYNEKIKAENAAYQATYLRKLEQRRAAQKTVSAGINSEDKAQITKLEGKYSVLKESSGIKVLYDDFSWKQGGKGPYLAGLDIFLVNTTETQLYGTYEFTAYGENAGHKYEGRFCLTGGKFKTTRFEMDDVRFPLVNIDFKLKVEAGECPYNE